MISTPKYTFIDQQIIDISNVNKESLYLSFTSIGGKRGWLAHNYLWKMRSMIDKLIGGVGFRGRKHPTDLEIDDVIDFWRVADIQKNTRLLLKAEMKVPGDAWLEFKIVDNKFIQSAYFLPDGIFGKLYWYFFIPFHHLIFQEMANKIVKDAENFA